MSPWQYTDAWVCRDVQYFGMIVLAKMCSTQETLELMCAYYSEVLTAEKPHKRYDKFNVDMFTDAQCHVLFRFDQDHSVSGNCLFQMTLIIFAFCHEQKMSVFFQCNFTDNFC